MTAEETVNYLNALAAQKQQAPILQFDLQELPGREGFAEVDIACTITQIGGKVATITETINPIRSATFALQKEDIATRTLLALFYDILNS